MARGDPIVIERQAQTQADSIINMENIVKNQVKSIQELKTELKEKRAMYKDGYASSATYHEHETRVKDAQKARNSVRTELNKQPSQQRLAQEIKDIAFDLREKQKSMSDLLLDYKEQSGATQLELFDGTTVAIVESAKLVKV